MVEYNLQAHEIATANHALHTTEVADSAVTLGHAYAGIDSEQSQKTAEVYFKEALEIYEVNFTIKIRTYHTPNKTHVLNAENIGK